MNCSRCSTRMVPDVGERADESVGVEVAERCGCGHVVHDRLRSMPPSELSARVAAVRAVFGLDDDERVKVLAEHGYVERSTR